MCFLILLFVMSGEVGKCLSCLRMRGLLAEEKFVY